VVSGGLILVAVSDGEYGRGSNVSGCGALGYRWEVTPKT
jgi:hypothetical protein